MKILLDAMGGDNAPDAVIKGAVKAAKEIESDIVLIGNEEIINQKVKEFFDKDSISELTSKITIKHTTEQIEMEDIPTVAIKHKKDSSMVVGFKMLKEGEGDVFISAGNSGALLTGATLLVGRIKGIDRPAIAPMLPAYKKIMNHATKENLFIAGKHGIAPSVVKKFLFKLSVKFLFTNFPNPSVVFKKTFPVNPSVITASTSPAKQSLPSIFPIKLTPYSSACSFNKLYVSLTKSLPFVSSVPIFKRPTFGFSIPNVFFKYIVDI